MRRAATPFTHEPSLGHTVVHVSDWKRSNAFYRDVLGAELVENPEAAGNPLGGWAYRFGDRQLNVHGPWPGRAEPCCPAFGARGLGVGVYFRDLDGSLLELISYAGS